MNPTEAFATELLTWLRKRAECIAAGQCVHEHINDACPFAEATP